MPEPNLTQEDQVPHDSSKHKRRKIGRLLNLLAMVGVLAVSFYGLNRSLHPSIGGGVNENFVPGVKQNVQKDYFKLKDAVGQLEDRQITSDIQVADNNELQNDLNGIQLEINAHDYGPARRDMAQMNSRIKALQADLDQKASQAGAAIQHDNSQFKLQVPILVYHYTPPDFEQQLKTLQAKGYTSIDLDQLAAALRTHTQPPGKPVVITFDDGFANQMKAFQLLKKYNMKATFYIINGGQASDWCIGAGRRYDQSHGCGDAYLNWDQIRQLDRSGLITIASHTVDHLNLASNPVEVQRFQIFEGKRELEAQIGHPVRHFAYPYGSYTATTIGLVQQAGFETAVSTLPGILQTPGTIYNLRRTRDVNKLP